MKILLDEADYLNAKCYHWNNRFSRHRYYVYTMIDGKMIAMEKFLFSPASNQVVIHINEDHLDFRRDNILIIDRNHFGHLIGHISQEKTSIYHGVYYCKLTKKWWIRLEKDYSIIHDHCYQTEYEAAIAADYIKISNSIIGDIRNFPDMLDDEIESAYHVIRGKYGLSRQEIKSKASQGISRAENPRSKYVGITFDKRRPNKPWVARIKYQGKFIWIGSFYDEIDAARAYDEKAIDIYGEYARTNLHSQLKEIENDVTT